MVEVKSKTEVDEVKTDKIISSIKKRLRINLYTNNSVY